MVGGANEEAACAAAAEAAAAATAAAPASRLAAALSAAHSPRHEDEACGPAGGELSAVGWQQLLAVGTALGRAYAPLLSRDDASSRALQLISTDYPRTVLSATALLRGLLHGAVDGGNALGTGAVNGGVGNVREESTAGLSSAATAGGHIWPANYSSQATRAAAGAAADAFVELEAASAQPRLQLPQLSLPLRLHVVPQDEDPARWLAGGVRVCAAATAFERHRAHLWDAFLPAAPRAAAHLAALAGVADVNRSTDQLVDALYTRLCHGHALPCWPTGVDDDAIASAASTANDGANCSCASQRQPPCHSHTDAASPEEHKLTGAALAAPGCDGAPPGGDHFFWRAEDACDGPLLSEAAETAGAASAPVAAGARALATAPHGDAPGTAAAAVAGCLPTCAAVALMERADFLYAHRFSSPSTRLLAYPLLWQVLAQLEAAAAGRAGAPRMVVRAVHDTVLAPLLSALGWTRRAYPWPGYASRLALELWSDGGTPAADLRLRAVYNGRDITERLGLGSLEDFRGLVDSLYAPAASWEERCMDERALLDD